MKEALEKESMIAMCKVISAKSRKIVEEVLEMLDEPVLSTNQRLTRIEKEIKRLAKIRDNLPFVCSCGVSTCRHDLRMKKVI